MTAPTDLDGSATTGPAAPTVVDAAGWLPSCGNTGPVLGVARQRTAPLPPPVLSGPAPSLRIPRAVAPPGTLDLSSLGALPATAASPPTTAVPAPVPTPVPPTVLLTSTQACERFGVTTDQLLLAVADGQLTVHRVLGAPRFDQDQLLAATGTRPAVRAASTAA